MDLDFQDEEERDSGEAKEKVREVCDRIKKEFGRHPKIHKTRKGYHIFIGGLRMSFEESLEWRKKLSDDEKRIFFDTESEFKPKQILFTRKDGHEVKEIKYKDLTLKRSDEKYG